MRISYNPLWKMLIDKGMNKKDLREKSGISTASIASLAKEKTSRQMYYFASAKHLTAVLMISWRHCRTIQKIQRAFEVHIMRQAIV